MWAGCSGGCTVEKVALEVVEVEQNVLKVALVE